jgi:hypothetical protein
MSRALKVLRAKEEVAVIVVTPRLEAISSALHPWVAATARKVQNFLEKLFRRLTTSRAA